MGKDTKDGSGLEWLYDLITKTRKSRIESERRLLALDALVKHATVYYACLTVLLTLFSLFFDYTGISFLSIASAVIIAICTAYASAQNYAVRAERMKECYLDLQVLLFKLDGCREEGMETRESIVQEVSKQYSEILKRTDNHLTRDYMIAMQNDLWCKMDKLRYYFTRLCVYVIPVLVGIVFVLLVWPVL